MLEKAFSGAEMAKCGTVCVLGIVGGTLFLGSAVALVVICWRLDRVKKAVREKNNEENHEMTTPLSISVARNMTSEPLPLNFQMSALTAEMTALNIIKKYAVCIFPYFLSFRYKTPIRYPLLMHCNYGKKNCDISYFYIKPLTQ